MENTISIKKNYEFGRLYKKGEFYVGKFLILYVKKNNYANNRLGITVSKKYGNSVKRNRIRRLIRENYRLLEMNVKIGYDLVFVARPSEEQPDFRALRKEMKYLMRRLNIICEAE